MLAELFDGLVAAGTLALAAVTWRLARSTVTMANESRTARLDAIAPAVTVLQLWHEVKPVQRPLVADVPPPDIEPDIRWDMTKYGAHQIGIRVCVTLANEGRTTARVALIPGPEVEVESVEYEEKPTSPERSVNTGGAAAPKIVQQSSLYLLRPGMEIRVNVILWRSATQWRSEWIAGNGVAPSALGYVDAVVTSGSALVHDTCRLEFGRYPLVPDPTQDGWVIAAIGATTFIVNPPPLPVAIIGRMDRVYGIMKKTVAPPD